MKITKNQLKQIIKEELLREAQWGGFTGGAAPLDAPMRDSGPVPKEQLKKLWDIFIEMGKTPEDILATPEFKEAGIQDPSQLNEAGPRGVSDLFKAAGMVRWHLGSITNDAEDLRSLSKAQKGIDELLAGQNFEEAVQALEPYIERLGPLVQELSTSHKELQLLKDSLKDSGEGDGDPGFTLPRPKEDPMGRGAQTSKLRQKSTNWRK